ncbi:MAG: hypothetical protein OXG24_00700 [Gammaproteobacteria bacterium]|nr:hypothetical protein [Gammaproteobacteria bacterium]
MNKVSTTERIAELETSDGASRESRARRTSYILEALQLPEDGIFFCGGEYSLQSFEEVRCAYIQGLYLSTVLLSLACIEWEVAGRLFASGWEKAKEARLSELLSEAHERGMISGGDLETFQRLRKIRNAQAHFRPPGSSSSLLQRTEDENLLPNEILMMDAKRAVEALGTFLLGRSGFF